MKLVAILSFLFCCQLAYGEEDSIQQHLSASPFYKTASPEWMPSLSREGLFKTMPGLLVSYSRNFYGANFLEVQAAVGSRKYKTKGAFIHYLEEAFTVAYLAAGIGNRIQFTSCFATSVVVGAGLSKGWYTSAAISSIHSLKLTQVFGQLGLKFHLQLLPKWSLNFSSQYRMGQFNWGAGFEKANTYQGGMLIEYLSMARRL